MIDNGKGFDPKEKGLGFGLVGMRERCESLSGGMQLKTQPGSGVIIRISIASWLSASPWKRLGAGTVSSVCHAKARHTETWELVINMYLRW